MEGWKEARGRPCKAGERWPPCFNMDGFVSCIAARRFIKPKLLTALDNLQAFLYRHVMIFLPEASRCLQ